MGLPNVTVANDTLVGSEIEIAQRFAKAIGHRPVFVTIDWGALIPSLVSGKIDLVISCMFVTPEREQRVAFSDPYRKVGNYFYVLAERIPHQTLTVKDVTQGKVGVTQGSAHDIFARQHYPEIQLSQFLSAADVATAVIGKKVDAGLLKYPAIKDIVANQPLLTVLGW